ncbi:sensor histidine kinase [Microbulbifer halophilus]|uniref:Sensor histidine kinase n=1 Tax=Microbulbifer halophilus TaxID=453963 RepID=A0ABW5EB71_9GAMM|nr:histidine kinase [Microbulbifer halophilus]MCW8126632.1 histidine kinase [Microbulbifer halophilus]
MQDQAPPGYHRYAPWVWLIFLGFYLIRPFAAPMGGGEWLLFAVGLGLFLWAYFRLFRTATPAPYIWLVLLVALVEAPFNDGASAMFIYAAAFSGNLLPGRSAAWHLAAVLALLGLESWWLSLSPALWLPASLVSVAVAAMGMLDRVRSEATRQKLRDREEIERLAAVAERERIARDMHDVIGHNLSSIALKSELAERLLARACSSPLSLEQARCQVTEVQGLARAALAQAREAIAGYHRRELGAELERLRQWLRERGFAVEIEWTATALPARIESAAAMIFLEACTNIQRHSNGDRVHLTCRREGHHLLLRVADNGDTASVREGNGLLGIRERARELGGEMQYRAIGGVQLEVTLPLEDTLESA